MISTPALDSVMAKSAAMSLSSPIGMNSEVLNMKVENASATSGSHSLSTCPLLMDILFCIMLPLPLKNRAKIINFANR